MIPQAVTQEVMDALREEAFTKKPYWQKRNDAAKHIATDDAKFVYNIISAADFSLVLLKYHINGMKTLSPQRCSDLQFEFLNHLECFLQTSEMQDIICEMKKTDYGNSPDWWG